MTAGLELRDVTLQLGEGDTQVTALDGVSLSVGRGELVAVAGPSGSGKSSLLAAAGLLIRPTSGEVAVGGVDVGSLSDADRTAVRRERVGFVFQTSNLVPSLTAHDQLLLVRHLDGRIRAEDRQRAAELLAAVGMTHRADRRPHQLSGGERQRVGIARALMTAPDVLLVDEPTSALDHERAHEVVRLLAQETHERAVATVMVTHDPAILGHADRVVHITDGRLEA